MIPVRPESPRVPLARMIVGDHRVIAQAIGQHLGLGPCNCESPTLLTVPMMGGPADFVAAGPQGQAEHEERSPHPGRRTLNPQTA